MSFILLSGDRDRRQRGERGRERKEGRASQKNGKRHKKNKEVTQWTKGNIWREMEKLLEAGKRWRRWKKRSTVKESFAVARVHYKDRRMWNVGLATSMSLCLSFFFLCFPASVCLSLYMSVDECVCMCSSLSKSASTSVRTCILASQSHLRVRVPRVALPHTTEGKKKLRGVKYVTCYKMWRLSMGSHCFRERTRARDGRSKIFRWTKGLWP